MYNCIRCICIAQLDNNNFDRYIFRKAADANRLGFVMDTLIRKIKSKSLEAQHAHGGCHPSLEVR